MKKLFLVVSLFMNQWVSAQNVSINAGGAVADPSALLDISGSTQGLLIPRVALTSTSVAAPVVTPAVSLMIYNTATAGTFPTDISPGYYYWSGARWIRQVSNKVALWVYPPTNVNRNTRYTFTATIPGHSSGDAAMVNLFGDWATAPSVTIEHVESITNGVRFSVLNRTGVFGTDYIGMDFIVTTIKP